MENYFFTFNKIWMLILFQRNILERCHLRYLLSLPKCSFHFSSLLENKISMFEHQYIFTMKPTINIWLYCISDYVVCKNLHNSTPDPPYTRNPPIVRPRTSALCSPSPQGHPEFYQPVCHSSTQPREWSVHLSFGKPSLSPRPKVPEKS